MSWAEVLKFKRNHPERHLWVQKPPKSWILRSLHSTSQEAKETRDRMNEWYIQHGEVARGMVRQISLANSSYGELWGVFRKGKYSGRSYPDSHKV